MKKIISLICLIALTLTQLTTQPANAARMGRGAVGWWVGYQGEVCRDGATLAWLWDNPSYSDTRSTLRLWEGNPNSGRLIALAPMSPTVHLTGTQFNLDEIGARGTFTVYAVRDVNWFPLLAPGSAFTIEDLQLGVNINATVQNCLLATSHAPVITPGSTKTFTPLDLRSPSLSIPDATMRYRIVALPTHGTLKLNTIALVVGGSFTQDDVAEGRLKYTHTNDAASNDSFRYRLDGTLRVSLSRAFGIVKEADGASYAPTMSANGGVVAFASDATNLDETQTDSGSDTDAFVWLGNQFTRRVSLNTNDDEANGSSLSPALSADGGRIAFASRATNLVLPSQDCPASIADSDDQIYRRDIGFIPFTNGLAFSPTVRQSASSGAPPSCARGNSTSYSPVVAEDGSVAFLSGADNLLAPAADPTGKVSDVFRHNITTTSLLAVRPATSSGYFGVNSFAVAGTGNSTRVAVVAADGFTIGDNNGFDDVFVQSPTGNAASIITASVSLSNTPANGRSFTPAFSRDGRFVAFESSASNLVISDTNSFTDIFVRNLQTNVTVRASVGITNGNPDGNSGSPHLSADGRFIAFESSASNLVISDTNGQPDIFVRDLQSNQTYLISQPLSSGQANGASSQPRISDDGHHISFASLATNLVSEGGEPVTDVDSDIFMRYFDPDRTFSITIFGPRVYLPLITSAN